ncbi:deoxyribodipyrimidine photolyase [Candidatus Saccharibacteria bacterium]|nr:deoxyribodipyrimidine photolyase [Candidatus Saccharibacteria bacterium]MBQ69839.1 deoxyribodipyrimidine photolyase [Candidatus Saccharibacteria bacterium]|tara:strand:- start:2529 stop:3860 length:1332 start_codon:yes stop_codon:yes gene_type:complete
MSRDQRTQDNHALLCAQQFAQENKVPLYVLFVLKKVPNRRQEHYAFMIDGLKEVKASLEKHDIAFSMQSGDSVSCVQESATTVDAGAIFFDFHPQFKQRQMRQSIASQFDGYVAVVDTHNLIPAWVTSDKQEFAAYTIRRKIHKYIENYLKEPGELQKHPHPASVQLQSMSDQDIVAFISDIPSSGITLDCEAGQAAALSSLNDFLQHGLERYAVDRNDPTKDAQSRLSPYLHFGQLSSLRVALELVKHTDRRPLLFDEARMPAGAEESSEFASMDALLEELIVRKELSDNFCLYLDQEPTSLTTAPAWAQASLKQHQDDPRDHLYTYQEWEAANTHDEAWNAAQRQLVHAGRIHGYMRMYWAKKILEWSTSPEEALETAIRLNDTYSIDGGDPNGYVGILWSIAGLHDRPWTERPIFGKIRYMNAAGLKRKFDIALYIDQQR